MTYKISIIIFMFTFLFYFQNCSAYKRIEDGIVLQLTKRGPNDPQLLKIQVCNDEIIHILSTTKKNISSRSSLMVNKIKWAPVSFIIDEQNDFITLSTKKLSVKINKVDGTLTFLDLNGRKLLVEKSGNSKIITPAKVMEEDTYHIQQFFESPEDEAFYGFGAHQNGLFNYKTHDLDLWQLNIVNAIPFLISSNNYGILWDNNSRTKFGDIRDYQSINSLKLYDKDGQEGGLVAEYYADTDFTNLFTSRPESKIEHEFIDVNDEYPEGFPDKIKAVRWIGEIESSEAGIHKFRLYCSGYTKMWLNDELVVDNWRQNWLPWTHLPKLNMEPGKRYKIKIEWVHTGGYICLKYLTPQDAVYDNHLSLYSEVADQIDYYFIYGEDTDKIIHGYREITGKAPMMPKWAMGLWQCRERYKTQDELISVVKEFRKRHIPLDNIVQDWFYWEEDKWGSHEFDASRYPDPKGMIQELHTNLNTQLMISVWPKFYVGTEHYSEFNEHGWLYKRNVEKQERDWVGPGYVSTFYDPYNSDAGKLFWSQINEHLFGLGIDAWWLDATEPDIHSNLSRPETRLRIGPTALGTAARYLNTYSLMNSKSVYEGQRKASPDQRVFILTRSAFPGQQRYAAATWSGDVASRWHDLKMQIPVGLNFSLSGIPYWTTDIGGFAVEERYNQPNEKNLEEWRELNTRWFQFGTFCPLFRVHGQFPYREMFNIAPDDHPAFKTMLAYDKLRYRLMPYIYSLTGMVTHNDYTIMRALVMDFGQDNNTHSIGDQFMFGPSLLISPVTDFKARKRNVYLPDGTGWYDLKSGRFYLGGQTIEADAPYTDIPIFVKEGSIIPCGPAIEYTSEKPADPIRLFIYSGQDASFNLYEDEGTNNNYENGMFAIISIEYNDTNKTLRIGKREGSFPGMLETRVFEIIWITNAKSTGMDFDIEADKNINYTGEQILIEMNKQ